MISSLDDDRPEDGHLMVNVSSLHFQLLRVKSEWILLYVSRGLTRFISFE